MCYLYALVNCVSCVYDHAINFQRSFRKRYVRGKDEKDDR